MKTRDRAGGESGCFTLIREKTEKDPAALSESASPAPLVAISILNWNGWEDSLECLESVRRLDYPNYLTVVVDNGSSNGSADKIKAWAEANLGPGHVLADYSRETALAGGDPETEQALDRTPSPARMVLIRNEENLGFTGGNNVAIHYEFARIKPARYALFLNNDCTPKEDALRELVATETESQAGVVGAVILSKENPSERYEGPFFLTPSFFLIRSIPVRPHPPKGQKYWPSDYVAGTAMLIRSEVLEKIHRSTGEYLSDKLYLYWDDQLFCHQARREGFSPVFARDALVYHRWGGSIDGIALNYYLARNKIFVANMALPFRWKLLFHCFNVPVGAVRVVRLALRGKVPVSRAMFWGMVDGYCSRGGKWKHHNSAAKRVVHPAHATLE